MKITDEQIKEASYKKYSCKENCDQGDHIRGGKCDKNGCMDKPHRQLYEAFQEGAKWAIEQMQNQWISVEDQLPNPKNDFTPFLVYLSGGHGRTIATFVKETKNFTGYDSPETVIHWLPLPEPPSK